jgi:hypothetical protein
VSELCLEHLPPPAELARLTENVQAGRREAFVGTGNPDTVLACADGEWRLGDVLDGLEAAQAAAAAVCGAETKAGTPCQRAPVPGEDHCSKHQDNGESQETGSE